MEEAVENVSGILRLYDLRMKTQNRMLTSRIMSMADVTEEVTTDTLPHSQRRVRCREETRKYTLLPNPHEDYLISTPLQEKEDWERQHRT